MDKQKLLNAYVDVEMLEALRLPVSQHKLAEIKGLERQYLQENVLPSIIKEIEPFLQFIRSDISMGISYSQSDGLTFNFDERSKQKVSSEGEEENTRDCSRYSIDGGKPLKKRRFVLAVVKDYVLNHPKVTFEELEKRFPSSLNISKKYGVVRKHKDILQEIDRRPDLQKRFFLRPEDLIILYDGTVVCVYNQWGRSFDRFLPVAEELHKVERYERKDDDHFEDDNTENLPTQTETVIKPQQEEPIIESVKEDVRKPINGRKLERAFDKKASSYKYFWFLAIISLAKERHRLVISYNDILIRMAAMAWPIVFDYEIDLGKSDMIAKYLEDVTRRTSLIKGASSKVVENYLKQHFNSQGVDKALAPLLKNVPYRFLSPWIPFTTNEEVVDKSNSGECDCLYALHEKEVVLDEDWWEYIKDNYSRICDFAKQSFLTYVKQYNHNMKLLKFMTNGWDLVS